MLQAFSRRQVMIQIFDAVTQTVVPFAEKYGGKVAVGVLAFVGCGIVLRLLARVFTTGRSNES
jgi:hypothetical protein